METETQNQTPDHSCEWVQAPDGKILGLCFGKYKPNLTFVNVPSKRLNWKLVESTEFNLPESKMLELIQGKFFMSKSGKPCFTPNPEGEHFLIREDWGGAYSKSKHIICYDLPSKHYTRNASSNGGGTGIYYCVVKVGTLYNPPVEDYTE